MHQINPVLKGLINREILFAQLVSLFFWIQHIKIPLYAYFGAFRRMGTPITITDCNANAMPFIHV